MGEMAERVARAMAVALKANCTNIHGDCYAHGFNGPCPQEGGWPGEVDGEFDLEVLARAAIAAMREPTEAMEQAVTEWARDGCGCPCCYTAAVVWPVMIDTALGEKMG